MTDKPFDDVVFANFHVTDNATRCYHLSRPVRSCKTLRTPSYRSTCGKCHGTPKDIIGVEHIEARSVYVCAKCRGSVLARELREAGVAVPFVDHLGTTVEQHIARTVARREADRTEPPIADECELKLGPEPPRLTFVNTDGQRTTHERYGKNEARLAWELREVNAVLGMLGLGPAMLVLDSDDGTVGVLIELDDARELARIVSETHQATRALAHELKIKPWNER